LLPGSARPSAPSPAGAHPSARHDHRAADRPDPHHNDREVRGQPRRRRRSPAFQADCAGSIPDTRSTPDQADARLRHSAALHRYSRAFSGEGPRKVRVGRITNWPGGTRSVEASSRRPRKPRGVIDIAGFLRSVGTVARDQRRGWGTVGVRRGPKPVEWAGLAEGEGEGLYAWVVEGDLERAVGDRAPLTDELVQPRLRDGSRAVVVDVVPVV
jgi:hypothetical protein